ncbi:MAG TPA: GNAT family N-acetyltransferase [Trichocoleus sp.]
MIRQSCHLRPLTADDSAVVWQMLMYAAHESSLEAVKAQPALVRYAADWGRLGDLGVGAWVGDMPVGAAWLRLWQGHERGFGFVDERVPELAIAVLPDFCNRGMGTQLLRELLRQASYHYLAVSLSVRANNPCVGLYQRLGFIKMEGSERINRTGGISFSMIYQFAPAANVVTPPSKASTP